MKQKRVGYGFRLDKEGKEVTEWVKFTIYEEKEDQDMNLLMIKGGEGKTR